jgi:flagellar hook-length control protein FliK
MSAVQMLMPASSQAATVAGAGAKSNAAPVNGDMSFFASLMAGLIDTSFFAPQPVTADAETPVSFGGTAYNLDPALFVISAQTPEDTLTGTDSDPSTLLQDPAFLSALTPAIPAEDLCPACRMPVSATLDGEVSENIADPRLIATGLDPVALGDLAEKLATIEPGAISAVDGNAIAEPDIAFISFLPVNAAETSANGKTQGLQNALEKMPDHAKGQDVVSALLSGRGAPVTTAESETEPAADAALSSLLAATNPEGSSVDVDAAIPEDDQLKFRLARLTGRERDFGAAATPSVTADTTAADTSPTAGKSAGASSSPHTTHDGAVKGEMSSLTGTAGNEGKTSALNALAADFLALLGLDPSAAPLGQGLAASPQMTQGQTALTNPALCCPSAGSPHPATETVGKLILRGAKSGDTQTLAIQLDPPELGRVKVQMKYEAGEPLKVHVVVEKADTLAMLQRDSHALQHALGNAGIETNNSSLSFDLAQGQNAFEQALGQDGSGGSSAGTPWGEDSADAADIIETQMNVFIDPETGLTHYNLLV